MNNVHLVLEPKTLEFDGLKIGAVPWITIDNHSECLKFIQNCPAKILISHLELEGFEMMKGMPVASHGMDHKLFKKYDKVLSGHYHTKSNKDNIFYLGTPFEQTWADVDDPKFFHTIDTVDGKLEAVRNPLTIFNRIIYNDSEGPVKLPAPETITNSFIKIIVGYKKDLFAFDKFIDSLHILNPFEIKISDTADEFKSDNVETDEDTKIVNDTANLLNHYVDNVETELDKDRLKQRLQELFVEAQNQEL
jgi:DNA repair exonuclease SbcCD nuclease subunit